MACLCLLVFVVIKFDDVAYRVCVCVCVHAMFDAVHLYSCWRMSAHPRLLTKRFNKQYVKYIFAGQMVSLCIMHAVVCTKVGVFPPCQGLQ